MKIIGDRLKLRFIVLGLLLAAAASRAATLTVTSTADSGPGSLRAALAAAADGDTIDATGISGTILLTSGELLVTNSLTISGPGPANLALDGNASSRVLHVRSESAVTLSGLTITNGNDFSDAGGGIFNFESTLTLSNCAILGTIYGSGLLNISGPGGTAAATVVGCRFVGNNGGNGGGILNGAILKVKDSFFGENSGGSGGGIENDGEAEIVNATFVGNTAYGYSGGAIFNWGTLAITNSFISSNSAVSIGMALSGGGGLRNDGMATVVNTLFSNNVVATSGANSGFIAGGGINNFGTMDIINCTIRGNSVVGTNDNNDQVVFGSGGGIYNAGTMNVVGVALIDNSSTDGGSGFENSGFRYFIYGGTNSVRLVIANSTLQGSDAHNEAAYYSDVNLSIVNCSFWNARIFNSLGPLQIGSSILDHTTLQSVFNFGITSLGYNLSSDNGGGFLTNATDLINTDPLLGPLQDNGGPTWTHALLLGSPAIDKGKNLGGGSTDQRGQPRTYDNPGIPNASGGHGTDIGAVEFIPPTISVKHTATNTVMVYWPSPSTGFNPQVNQDLNTTNWAAPSETVQDDGSIKYFIVNPPTGNRFYRLKSP